MDKMRIFEEAKAKVGQELFRAVSPPVSLSDIRKHAIAVYWPEKPPRLFWDEEYARQTVWGGIVAPEEFNPFAWPIEGPGRFPHGLVPAGTGYSAADEGVYYVRMRPGDVITAIETLVDAYERTGRAGRLLFTIPETRWTNQRGELVKTHRWTSVMVLRS